SCDESERATSHARRDERRSLIESRSRFGEARAWRMARCCLMLWAIGTGSALAKTEPGAAARKPAAAKPEGAGAGSGESSSTKATSDKSTSDKSTAAKPPSAAASGPPQRFDIDEFRIEGADSLRQIEVEAAVYPFLGPRRTSDDVEKARAAVE